MVNESSPETCDLREALTLITNTLDYVETLPDDERLGFSTYYRVIGVLKEPELIQKLSQSIEFDQETQHFKRELPYKTDYIDALNAIKSDFAP